MADQRQAERLASARAATGEAGLTLDLDISRGKSRDAQPKPTRGGAGL